MKTKIEQIAANSLLTLAAVFLATNAVAGNYNYEVGLSFGSSDTDTATSLAAAGPDTPLGSLTSSSDSDRLELSGTWYYSGLSDKNGPKSRAAFLDRASSLNLAYSYEDLSGSSVSSGLEPPLPPGIPTIPAATGSTDGTSHTLVAGLRHVWEPSGWYGLAGVTRNDSEIDSVFGDFSSSFDTDATAYTLGIGKYLGQATALDLSVISSDLDGNDATTWALSFNHVGSVGSSWHYAADLGVAVSDADEDDGTYLLGLSLFPTTELEFGFQFSHREGAFESDIDSYEGFASWFVRDHVELHARYRTDDFDTNLFTDFDSDQFAIGVNVRF